MAENKKPTDTSINEILLKILVKKNVSDPIHKATIIPRGRALGMVMRLPERDHNRSLKCR